MNKTGIWGLPINARIQAFPNQGGPAAAQLPTGVAPPQPQPLVPPLPQPTNTPPAPSPYWIPPTNTTGTTNGAGQANYTPDSGNPGGRGVSSYLQDIINGGGGVSIGAGATGAAAAAGASGPTGAQPAYFDRYPDVANAYYASQQIQDRWSPAEYADWHYNTFTANGPETREDPATPYTPTGGGTGGTGAGGGNPAPPLPTTSTPPTGNPAPGMPAANPQTGLVDTIFNLYNPERFAYLFDQGNGT